MGFAVEDVRVRHRRALIAARCALALIVIGGLVLLGYRQYVPQQTSVQQTSVQDAARQPAAKQPAPPAKQPAPAAKQPAAQPASLRQSPSHAAIFKSGAAAIETIGTFSYTTVDRDLRRMVRVTTGDLRRQLRARLPGMKRQIVAQRMVKQATVVRAHQAVVEGNRTKGSVTLIIRSAGRSKAQPSVQVQRFRVRLTMAKVNGAWLVTSVTTPTPVS